MKCTPQKTMTSALGLGRFARQAERIADEVGDVLHFGALVVVGEDDRVALARQSLDLALQFGHDIVAAAYAG